MPCREGCRDAARSRLVRSSLPPVTYHSRVDAWLVLFVALIYAGVLYEAVFEENHLAWVVGAALALLLRLTALPCRYTLMPDHLLVRCGVQRWEIPYREIKSMRQSYNPITAPALSLRRLEIRHGPELTLVSPRSRDEFVKALRARMKFQRQD